LKLPGTKRLKLKSDKALSSVDFKFNLRRYNTGVARNPHVRATLDGIRKCSNPTCVEREDTIAGMARNPKP